MGLLSMIWNGIKSLGALVVWPVAKLKGVKGIRQVIRWTLHVICVCATLGLLCYLNYALELDKALRVPVATLRVAWLPLLFLLTYFTAWCAWWLWRLIMAEDRPSEHPDIDAAWNEATASLNQAGVDLTKIPLFLVLGRPAETEAAFFSATQLPFTQPQVPRDPNAPLHVHVSEEGVFVTCAGASLLGTQATLLAADRVWKREEPMVTKGKSATHKKSVSAVDSANLPPIHVDDNHVNDKAAPAQSGKATPIAASANQSSGGKADASSGSATATATPPVGKKETSKEAAQSSHQLTQGLALVEESIALLADEDAAVPEFATDLLSDSFERQISESEQNNTPLVKDLGEIQQIQARLEHLCRLIAHAREPYCPLNGVAVLIPYASTANDRMANQVAALAQRDLNTVQETLQMRCPLVAIVCDLHEAPGCKEMIQLFPEEQRHRRLGVRFPLMCNDPAASVIGMIDKGIRWVCRDLLPPLVYRLMRSSKQSPLADRDLSPSNVRLYRFLDEVRQREERLGRIMRQVFTAGKDPATSGAPVWLPAGCYFVANGTDLAREQGFAAGVLPQLWQMQNLLAWTPAALKKDRNRRFLVMAGYAGLACCLGLIVVAFVRLI